MSAAEWIDRVYRDVPGALVVNHADSAGVFHGQGGQCATHEQAVERIEALDAAGSRGVYLRVTTVARELGPHERGGSADAHCLPGLWADLDFGSEGHKHNPSKHDGRTLPPDEDCARQVLATSCLPAPSLWVHSGGGLYPWWLLDRAIEVTDENRDSIEALSSRWQETIQTAAHRLGYEYGAGVGDLARVLRVPGTTNRKAGMERPCRVVEDTASVYRLDELRDVLPPRPASQTASRAPAISGARSAPSESVLDAFAAQHSWSEILARYGFTRCAGRHGTGIAECFTRPGKPEHTCSAHVLSVNPHALVVWSESAGLPVGKGQKLTKARVAAHMEHDGDLSAFARSLAGGDASRQAAGLIDPRIGTAGASPHDDQAIEEALDAAAYLAREVEREAFRLRVREAARESVAAERATAIDLPGLHPLGAFLAVPDEDVTHRVDGLWPTGGRVVLSAPHKSGKTTLTGNLARSLADGEPFLDAYAVRPVTRVVMLDNELDERMLRRWLRDQSIANTAVVELVPLRGRLSTFNILDPTTRTRWAEHIGPADVLLFDCLRPALDALGLSEDKDAGRFLEALDELITEARIAEALVVHHMGHQGERSRGDSRILDWPDALWKLVKDPEREDEDTSRRVYFTAYGRDVDHPETLLTYHSETRRLSVGGGSRLQRKRDHIADAILEYVTESPGCTQTGIERAVEGRREVIRAAVKSLVDQGKVVRERSGQAYIHRTAPTAPQSAPAHGRGVPNNRAPAPIGARGGFGAHEGEDTETAGGAGFAARIDRGATAARPPERPCELCGGPNPDQNRASCTSCWPDGDNDQTRASDAA